MLTLVLSDFALQLTWTMVRITTQSWMLKMSVVEAMGDLHSVLPTWQG